MRLLKHISGRVFQCAATVLISACMVNSCIIAHADDGPAEASQIQKFSSDELRDLVAPIALYPDALLAQVLPASAYPLDVVAAYRYVQDSKDAVNPPDDVSWDSSVIALLHYPTVLKRMNDDISWTERLGVAATYQMDDVSDTIQQVRAEAQAAGNLATNDKQIVSEDQNVITVAPADPQVIYVPTYEPDVIFVRHDSWQPSWSSGFGYGVWLSNDFDWRYHRIGIHSNWRNGSWRRQNGSNYWRAPSRPIPSWYRRDGHRSVGPTSNYGYRSDSNISRGRTSRTSPTARSNFAPAQPTPRAPATAQPPVTRRSPSVTPSHAEGFERNGRQVQRESNRGEISRQNVQPARPQPVRPAPAPVARPEPSRPQPVRPAPAPSQNMMRPSSGPQTQRESSRGAASRGDGGGGGGGGKRR